MEVGLVLFALFVVTLTLRRGRRFPDHYREFPHTGLYDKGALDSLHLYGRHSENHLYPDRYEETSAGSEQSKAS